ncbi:MAG: tetratricopeptide repeat protein, partial [Anaerolineaceae bacterium]|nr:tetratricopeptide repeat protein [Anaerolineaceae bacterium]
VAPGRGPQGEATSESPYDQLQTDKTILSSLPEYPARLREFVTDNRADELTQYLNYLQNHRILFISGVGGIGKTTLVRALVETRPANVPLPFWFDFVKKPDATLGDVLEQLAGYLNAPQIAQFREKGREAGQDDINRLTDELGKRDSPWLIFDNLETALNNRNFHDPGIDSLFTSLRDSSHQAKIIITSRTLPVLADGGSLIDILEDNKLELKGLETNFALDYLVKNGLDKVEQSQLQELASSVDGHPLALKLLIGLVKKFGINDTLNDLSTFKRHKESTIKIARRLFYKLAGDEKELLEHISVFRQPETETAIKKMFTATTSEDAFENLMEKSLLETDHEGSYWLHPLVREFAYDDLENKKEVHEIAMQYYLSIHLPEERTSKEDIQPLIEAYYHACRAEDYEVAFNIIFDNDLPEDLDRWCNYRTLIDLYSGVLPLNQFKDKPLLDDIGSHSVVLGNLGLAYSRLGQVDIAIKYYEKALMITREIGDRCGEENHLGNLGLAYSNLGQVEKAIKCYEKSLLIAREIGDRRGEGADLGNLGGVYRNLGQVEKAIEYYKKALVISKEIGDRRGEGADLGNLGNAYSNLEQVDKAIEYYENALVIAKEIGDRRGEGADLGNLGGVYRNLGQVEKAIEYHEQALVISKEIGDKWGEGADLGNLGNAYSNLGQVEKAIEYYEQALVIAQEIGDRRGEGYQFMNLGQAYSILEQIEMAIDYYNKALAIGKEVKNPKIVNYCEDYLKSLDP